MTRDELCKKIAITAQLTGNFTLRSGKTSNTYFDKYLFESDPQLLRAIAEQLAPLLPADTEILCGLEMGGIPIVTMLSQVTGLPCAFIRKDAKPYGTCKYAEGPDLVGKRIVLVEDVVSSGGALLDAVEKLRADGIAPEVALCVIDRETGAHETLRETGVELRSLFTMSEIVTNR